MARRKKTQTSATSFIILVLFALGVYLYQEGYLDRWLDEAVPTETAEPAETNEPGEAEAPTARPTPRRPGARTPRPATAAPPGEVLELPAARGYAGSWYELYFTKPSYPERAENREGGVDAAIIADLDAAQTSIDVAVFEFDLPSLGDALRRAHERGVQVRLVSDTEDLDDPEMAELTGALEEAGVEVNFQASEPFMHNKFVIVDGSLLWVGSMNFTANDVYRNNNNMLRLAIPELVENYQRRFDHFLEGDYGSDAPKDTPNTTVELDNGVRIENYFSPNGGAAKAIERRLAEAQQSIRVLAFSYTADPQAELLIQKHEAGLQVLGVFEARNAEGSGADFGMLQSSGLDVYEDGNCYILHSKVYIVDDRTVIMGSYNFSANAERSNDENLLIIDDPALAAAYIEEFDRIYAQAQSPTRCGG